MMMMIIIIITIHVVYLFKESQNKMSNPLEFPYLYVFYFVILTNIEAQPYVNLQNYVCIFLTQFLLLNMFLQNLLLLLKRRKKCWFLFL